MLQSARSLRGVRSRQVSPRCWAVLVPSAFTKKTAIRITQMKIRIEIAEPSPRLTRLISDVVAEDRHGLGVVRAARSG